MGWRITTGEEIAWHPGKYILHAGVTGIKDEGKARVIVGVEYTITRRDGTSRVWPAMLVLNYETTTAELEGTKPDDEQTEALLATLADIAGGVGRALGYAGGWGFSVN